jgi:hypothetical protein
MPCTPFIGINRHYQTFQLGCAFIKNEKATTYEWYFPTSISFDLLPTITIMVRKKHLKVGGQLKQGLQNPKVFNPLN